MELLVTILIVAFLAVTVGVYFIKLLTIQERDREEAYIREKIVDVCAVYADFLSVGSYISTNSSTQTFVVSYRQETGGVSLETGVVSRASYLISSFNHTNKVINIDILAREPGAMYASKFSRPVNGSAHLIPLAGDVVSCTITPLYFDGDNGSSEDDSSDDTVLDGYGFVTSKAVMGYLEVVAKYKIENDDGEVEERTAKAGRVVRLWNAD